MAGSGGKKSAKTGRNAAYCKAYKTSHRREKNKLKKLLKLQKHHPLDKTMQKAIESCKLVLGIK